ncbi:unnamed protein product [Colias eurytheme]|nr:unnamed protein product [Colias eurytheme]
MEAILATQEQIISAMESLRNNFKKDGPERKTPAYIEKRLSTLDAYWKEFQINHTRLTVEFDDPNHKYFKENYYQSTLKFYNDTKVLISKYDQNKPLLRPATPLSQFSDRQGPAPSPPELGASHSRPLTTQGNNSRVDEMLRKQKSNFRAFSHTINSANLENLSERWELEDLLKNINLRCHNTLLHNAYVTYAPSTSCATKQKETPKSNILCISKAPQETLPKLLATAKVNIKSEDGCNYLMRALIDPCAESSLITENAAQLLGLPRVKRNCMVVGVGSKANNSKGVVKITISSLYSDFTIDSEAYVMKHVVDNLPSQSFRKPTWPHIEKLSLADPEFNISKPIDLILGVEVYELILLPGFIRNSISQPIAQNTELGWILSGSVATQSHCNIVTVNISNIQRFWEIEDISENSSDMSSQDQYCMQHYQLHTKRQSDGRYVVRLPLKPDMKDKLGDSKTKAIAQFRQLENRFTKNKLICESYKQFIHEYIYLKHMFECTGNQTPESYLPHHCVIRAESTTTATRVVFNASAKTSTGYSLNDIMYSGPNLQKDLLTLIISWRQYKIAFTADIEKMFRQILVNKKDQALQKIIWRDYPNKPLKEYQLATVTYGTKAAPFLAMMTLKQLAKDEASRFPEAAEVVNTSFYMDDLLHGHHDLQSAMRLKADLIALLRCGGFNLRKWSSNRLEMEESYLSGDDQTYIFKHQESTKALGLQWHSREDQFSFHLKTESPTKLTKRTLLSSISKIFDPLGWLSPATTNLKLLFQEVWLLDIKWDDVLPDAIISRWKTLEIDLNNINRIKIPRWLHSNKNDTIELHGFCDASEKAYACVIYCRVKGSPHTKPSVVIITAKSRLVPARKAISLPRLELCAAVLLSKLMKTALQCLSNFNIKIYCWSDSTAVLGWLNGEPSRWKPFVANRVKKVVDVIPSTNWRYVKSKENPADCATRGITADQLATHNIWWHGPTWLLTFNEETIQNIIYNTNEEIKNTVLINTSTMKYENQVIDSIFRRHSDFTRASRVLAWVLRMTTRLRNKPNYLTIQELRKSKILLIKHAQSISFTDDIDYIKKHNQPHSKSPLLKLNPFIDEQGVLRVGGRISKASIQHNMKHPAIIPHSYQLTDMLIDHAHKMTFHGGARLTLTWLRQQYWIIGGNNAVKKRLRKCVICRKHSPYKHDQLMGDLPAARTNITRPFYHTGVDFTGFVDIKSQKGRGVRCTKGYIAVFVCMATKAIHLELVSDLTASAFISALRRFAARRGTPSHVYSDNGTNFIKANRLLQEEILHLKSIIDEQFYTEITEMQIEWHFNAPSWPSAGGLWEAAVKSLKYHLKRVIGEQRLTYEEYSTLLAQLEACLNSRPLCTLNEDPEDLDVLTPAHFLSGGPTATIVETEKDLRTRWQLMQKIYQDIWKRWRAEYLTQLNVRSKWQRPKPSMQIGDIVLIHDANLPPGKWALGRIVELHPGKDGFRVLN